MRRILPLLLLTGALGAGTAAAQETDVLDVLVSTTDLREIAKEIGGRHVAVTCLTKGPEDPHFIEARPSLIRAAAKADVLIVVGADLEIGYEPLLLSESRNKKIQKGSAGYVDVSTGIPKLEVPTGPVDRSMGDVHPDGNPHFLLDPARAKKAAATITDAFVANDPSHADDYRAGLTAFQHEVDVAMWGEPLLAEVPAKRLERYLARGKLREYLREKGLESKLGGLAAVLSPYAGRKVVSYHGLFVYLLDRFGIEEAAKLEPKPGIAPTPTHLARVVARMQADDARVILHASFQPARNVERAAQLSGGTGVELAHMPGALPGTASYVDTLRHNVTKLAEALAGSATR